MKNEKKNFFSVAIIIRNQNVMFLKQKDKNSKQFVLPKTEVKLGESPEKAIVSEIHDSLNIDVSVRSWLSTHECDQLGSKHIYRIYLCDVEKDIEEDNCDIKWVSSSDFETISLQFPDKTFWEEIVEILKSYKKYRIWPLKREGDLYTQISRYTSTIELMDKFEGKNRAVGPYKRMIIKDVRKEITNGYLIQYHLIVERFPDVKHTVGHITFTDFKSDKGVSVYNFYSSLYFNLLKKNTELIKTKEFYFFEPICLRAQNSSNREGYGWEWDWSGGVGIPYPGTFYGETTDYAFVGILIDKIEKTDSKVLF